MIDIILVKYFKWLIVAALLFTAIYFVFKYLN